MTEPDDVAGVSWTCGVFDGWARYAAEIFEIYSGRYVRFNGAACDDTEIGSPWYLGAFPPIIIVTLPSLGWLQEWEIYGKDWVVIVSLWTRDWVQGSSCKKVVKFGQFLEDMVTGYQCLWV